MIEWYSWHLWVVLFGFPTYFVELANNWEYQAALGRIQCQSEEAARSRSGRGRPPPFSFLDFVGLFSFASPYRFGPHISFSLGNSTHIDTMGLSGRKEKQRIPNDPRNLSWANSTHLSYLFCTAFTDYISLSPPPFRDDFTLSGYSSKMRPNLVKPISQSWAGTRHKVSASQATGVRKPSPSNKS